MRPLIVLMLIGLMGLWSPALAQKGRVVQTGQTTCHDVPDPGSAIPCADTGQDGETQLGVPLPTPRFTLKQGTVTDKLTGLIWLRHADCFGLQTWAEALTDANGLASGACGLTDGSVAGDWRLPNVNELRSLIHWGFDSPALSNAAGTARWTEGDPFLQVQTVEQLEPYWSSTSYIAFPYYAWWVAMYDGVTGANEKSELRHVWPVRGGK